MLRTCSHCGEPLQAAASAHRHYCSDACRQAAYRLRLQDGEDLTPPVAGLRLTADALPAAEPKADGGFPWLWWGVGALAVSYLMRRDEKAPAVGELGRVPVGGDIVVPLVGESFYLAKNVTANRNLATRIHQTYRPLIDRYAALCGLDSVVLTAFIVIESGGNPQAHNGAALGLMQVDVPSATTAVFEARKAGLLTGELRAEVGRVFGASRLAAIERMRNQTPTKGSLLTTAELLRPAVNLLAGAIYLMVLVQRHTEGGVIRFDRVVVHYNKGINARMPAGSPDQVLATVARSNRVTASYITKLVGPTGVLTDLAA